MLAVHVRRWVQGLLNAELLARTTV
jgi:hypothetical protein